MSYIFSGFRNKVLIGLLLTFFISINTFSQANAIQESSDIIIYGDVRVYIDSAEQLVTHGSLIGSDGAVIENQGTMVFDINSDYQSIYNYASDNFFIGSGDYIFSGDADFYTGGDFENAFYNLWINKTDGSNLFLETNLKVNSQLYLEDGHVVTADNLVELTNTDSAAIDVAAFSNQGNEAYIEGNLRRHIVSGSGYHFPVGLSNTYFPLSIDNNSLAGVDYLDVAFMNEVDVPLTGHVSFQEKLYNFNELTRTGSWMIKGSNNPASGTMDVKAYIFDFLEYNDFETNMFGLAYHPEPRGSNDLWIKEGDYVGGYLASRRAGSDSTVLQNVSRFGYYTMATAEITKLINFISPGDGRHTIFYIPGITRDNENEKIHFEDTELIVYNAMGREIFQAKPYNNDLDMGEYRDGTYYYIFKFTRNGVPGVIQSFIDVKRVY